MISSSLNTTGMSSASAGGDERTPAAVIATSVLQSPVVRCILHAKIRDWKHNDVVLVGDHAIQIKQVREEGHLEHVFTVADFDATIRAAKVFTILSDNHDEEAIIKTEECSPSPSKNTLPPQCLVLALDSNDIVFLYLQTDSTGQHRPVHQSMPMPTFDRDLFQPGQYLAVDPRSRALAVAAYESEIVVYAAKPLERIQHELSTSYANWCPVSAQRPIKVDGVILQMDFLIPPTDDEDHVVLLVLVAHERRIKAIRVDWHYASDIHHARMHEALPLDQPLSAPGLLIPLRNAAFLLTNGDEIKRFDNILSGSVSCQAIKITHEDPLSSGESPRRPVWTNWCRPERGKGSDDQLYLAREDGNIFHVYEHGSPAVMNSSSNAGNMDCHIGTAFASVGGLGDPDILVAAGDMSSGCVKEIGPRFSPSGATTMSRSDTMEMRPVESIPNWGSVTDMMASTLPGKSERTRDGVFVTSGRQPFGAITELRYGLEVRLSVILPLEALGSAQAVWTLPRTGVGDVLVILSGPAGTTFFSLYVEDEEAEVEPLEPSSLESKYETLLAAMLSDGRLLQVTNKTVCVAVGTDASFEDRVKIEKEGNNAILFATCNVIDGVLITAEQTNAFDSGHILVSYLLDANEESDQDHDILDQLSSMNLPDEPLAVACIAQHSETIAFTSDVRGKLTIFALNKQTGWRNVCDVDLPASEDGPGMCDSIAVLRTTAGQRTGSQSQYLVVCGLRDGRIFSMIVTWEAELEIDARTALDFGQSSVRVTQPGSDTSTAYAMSGLETCKLSWGGGDGAALRIESLWITDKDQPELAQGAVSACAHTPPAHLLSSPKLADSVGLLSGNGLLIGSLEQQPATVPRQIPVSGTPHRLLYLHEQRCVACASLVYGVRAFSSAPLERRQVWPIIDFIPTKSGAPTFSHEMQPGERVYALLEWSFKHHDDKVYSFLLVGGSYVSARSRSTRGRITFLQPTNKSWEVVDVKEGRQMRFDEPIYCLALLDPTTFVACSGCDVFIYRFDRNERKWEGICAPYKLHSAGTAISVNPGHTILITISTSKDSSVVLRLTNVTDPDREYGVKLERYCTAPRADSSLHHLTPTNGTCLLTSKNGKLIGLKHPPPNTNNTSSRILFEVPLPRSLTRIRQANLRPRWKPAPPPGVLVSDIIGCSADGTLTGILLIDEPLWRRLSWLQRLCEWSEELSPHSHHTPAYSVSGETFARGERGMPIGFGSGASERESEIVMTTDRRREMDRFVDGDVLRRVLEHGGAACLRRVVREAAARGDVVGEWMRERLDEELEAVDEMVDLLEYIVNGWL